MPYNAKTIGQISLICEILTFPAKITLQTKFEGGAI